MRAEAVFYWKHRAEMLSSLKISLLNIPSWNGHIAHFLAETIYPTTFSLMCFTETTRNWVNFRYNGSYENSWKSFHRLTGHVFGICFKASKIFFVEKLPIISPVEILPVLFIADDTHMSDDTHIDPQAPLEHLLLT